MQDRYYGEDNVQRGSESSARSDPAEQIHDNSAFKCIEGGNLVIKQCGH